MCPSVLIAWPMLQLYDVSPPPSSLSSDLIHHESSQTRDASGCARMTWILPDPGYLVVLVISHDPTGYWLTFFSAFGWFLSCSPVGSSWMDQDHFSLRGWLHLLDPLGSDRIQLGSIWCSSTSSSSSVAASYCHSNYK